MCASCPYHGYTDQVLILYFVNGLDRDDASMLSSACGGNIQNKTIIEAQKIIEDLSISSRHFRTKVKGVINVKNSSSHVNEAMVNDVRDLKAMMREMMNEKNKARVCGICDSVVHATNECPHQP